MIVIPLVGISGNIAKIPLEIAETGIANKKKSRVP
jgi:hypothetical protein